MGSDRFIGRICVCRLCFLPVLFGAKKDQKAWRWVKRPRRGFAGEEGARRNSLHSNTTALSPPSHGAPPAFSQAPHPDTSGIISGHHYSWRRPLYVPVRVGRNPTRTGFGGGYSTDKSVGACVGCYGNLGLLPTANVVQRLTPLGVAGCVG